jgi:hypothetical protein
LKILQIVGKKKDDWSIHSFDFINIRKKLLEYRINLKIYD